MSNGVIPAAGRGESSPADPMRSLGDATRRIAASTLNQQGVKSVRVLNESRFRSILERIVEERIRARLNGESQESCSTSEDLRLRWEGFRARYEEKLRFLEARLQALAGGPSPPSR